MITLVILMALGLFALLAEVLNLRKILLPVLMLGLLAAIIACGIDWQSNTDIPLFKGMVAFDKYAMSFTGVLCLSSLLWFIMARGYLESSPSGLSDRAALMIFSLTGGAVLVAYSNLTMFFLGIEILSIPMYVMASSDKNNLNSNEAGLKYFLLGAFATGFLLFGVALIYGVTATFSLEGIKTAVLSGAASSPLLIAGILFVLVGLSFKISAVPFHFWAPDVYTGAPTPVTAFMATIVKTSAFAAFLKLLLVFAPLNQEWTGVLWGITVLTLLLGNIVAVYQHNVKRMLAYSGIAHAGYMLLGLLALNDLSVKAILFYTLAYSVATISAFAVLYLVEKSEGNTLHEAFAGLAKRNKLAALAMTAAMLSMAGIPPMAGFFGKYFIFSAAIRNGYTWPVLIAVLGSLISVYYYFRVIISMYFRENEREVLSLSLGTRALLIICTLLLLAFGVFAEMLMRLV